MGNLTVISLNSIQPTDTYMEIEVAVFLSKMWEVLGTGHIFISHLKSRSEYGMVGGPSLRKATYEVLLYYKGDLKEVGKFQAISTGGEPYVMASGFSYAIGACIRDILGDSANVRLVMPTKHDNHSYVVIDRK